LAPDPEIGATTSHLDLSEINEIREDKKMNLSLKRRLSECSDTNEGAVGFMGCGCECEYEGYCGYSDTEDFIANEMCCSCGGGSETSTSSESTCEDTNNGATDS
jgi:hypothetical protein